MQRTCIKKDNVCVIMSFTSLDTQNQQKIIDSYLNKYNSGDIFSLYHLAYIYQFGEHKDRAQADVLASQYYHDFLKKQKPLDNVTKGIVYNSLGLLHEHSVTLKNNKYAELCFLKAIKKNDLSAYINLAIFYFCHKRIKDAKKYFKLSIKKDPYNHHVYNGLACVYFHDNKFIKSEQNFMKAIDYGSSDSLYNLANLYHKENKLTLATQYYSAAWHMCNDHIKIMCQNSIKSLYPTDDCMIIIKKFYNSYLINKSNQLEDEITQLENKSSYPGTTTIKIGIIKNGYNSME
ncbi:MAG: hypothetical protein Edafosvirus3_36 [Edafosvirus sp.]|uniref:Tetratricopeptide repeat protein n=1 Tax=Edafosvirus sp. TaxID=2487765 RepID=A0A3G4ZSU4_9VIRU|nr:MAG: hypothetical protein Edafosvirus3_36 [Edafosvirus sp.]